MVPLAACAVAAVVISIVRVRALQRERVLPRFLRAAIEKLKPGTDVDHLWRLADENPAALARITRAGIRPRVLGTASVIGDRSMFVHAGL